MITYIMVGVVGLATSLQTVPSGAIVPYMPDNVCDSVGDCDDDDQCFASGGACYPDDSDLTSEVECWDDWAECEREPSCKAFWAEIARREATP